MKKTLSMLLALAACSCAVFGLAACNGGGNDKGNGDDETGKNPPIVTPETPTTPTTPTTPETPTTPAKPVPPTAAEIVAARAKAASATVQGYDFDLSFSGDFNVLNLGPSLGGKYEGAYRYNGDTNEVSFKRTTSGALLADSTCYVFTSGDNRIKATMDGNTVKKLSVETEEDQDITMVNLPIVKIVDSVKASGISDIKELANSTYAYSCKLAAGNDNLVYTALGKVFEKLGTGVSFKGINLAGSSSTFDFNIKDGKIDDFRLGFSMQIDVKAVNVVLGVNYEQKGSQTTINLPNTASSGLLYKAADLQTEVAKINAAIDDIRNDEVYSLDLTAKNEFDPGWNKNAIVDKYTAKMYKKTIDGVDWFNHSYFYKAHSETDGKETYKYTLGNVNGADEANQGTWLISRKGSNTQTKVENVTADTQFDFLTSVVKQNAAQIDCIKKQTSGTTVTYTVYLGKTATAAVQEKITAMINTNAYDDVIPVNNYFNTDNIVKDASLKIVITDGKLTSVDCDTKLTYTPIAGDYDEYNITLDNAIELKVNKDLAKAQKYEVPDKVKGNAIGWGNNLNDSEYYII